MVRQELLLLEVERVCHIYQNGDVRCGRIKQWVSKWDSKVSVEEEIKAETTTTSNIYRVYDKVKVEMQIKELHEKNACRRVLHDLRMTRQYTVG